MKKVVIIGAGPAGITAGYELMKKSKDYDVTILEKSGQVGGIARTVEHNGNRMDLGGHRFFTKSEEVKKWWEEILAKQGQPASDDRILKRSVNTSPGGPDPEFEDEVMLVRKRISSIYFNEKFFEYPVKFNSATVKGMGFGQTAKAGFSYLESSIFKKKENNLENYYLNHFGKQLYQTFFEGYTEKLWGRHPSLISADWGAQRLRGISISSILKDTSHKKGKEGAGSGNSELADEFLYPKLGPGQLWELAAKRFTEMGGRLYFGCNVTGIEKENNVIKGVRYTRDGQEFVEEADIVISTMPVKNLIAGMKNVPFKVEEAAKGLPYRDLVVLGMLVPALKIQNTTKTRTIKNIVPDCWIYVQDTSVKLGRIQIYNNWSPYLVDKPEDTVWIGLEYFCNEGDYYWNQNDIQWQTLAVSELVKMGIITDPPVILDFHKEMVEKAYPGYFDTYGRFDEIRAYLDTLPNLYCIGRNGQHRYNNMDHAMITAFEAVRTIMSGKTDKTKVWNVNVTSEYHESSAGMLSGPGVGAPKPQPQLQPQPVAQTSMPLPKVDGAVDPDTAASMNAKLASDAEAMKNAEEKKKSFNPMLSIRDRLSHRGTKKPRATSNAVNYALLSGEDESTERNSYRNAVVPVRSNYQEPSTPVSESTRQPIRRRPSGVHNNSTMPEDTYVVGAAPVKKDSPVAIKEENTSVAAAPAVGAPVFEEPAPAPVVEEPVFEAPVFEEPAPAPVVEEPVFEEPAPAPVFEEPAPAPVVEEPVFEAPVFEEPAPAPVVEEPVFEAPVFEEPAPAPVVEEPVFEEPAPAPVVEEPVFEAPVFEEPAPAPVVEEPVFEAPVFEEPAPAPVVEEPVFEEPVFEEPAPAPVVEEPVFEAPVFEEPSPEPAVETPAYEEPVYAEPVAEVPVYTNEAYANDQAAYGYTEPVYEQPVYEQPAYEQNVYEQPSYEQPVYEQQAMEQTVAEQPVQPVVDDYDESVYDASILATAKYDPNDPNAGSYIGPDGTQTVFTPRYFNEQPVYDDGFGYDDGYSSYASRNEEYDTTYTGYKESYGGTYDSSQEVYHDDPSTYSSNEETTNVVETKVQEGDVVKSNNFGSIFEMPTEEETRGRSNVDMPYVGVAPTISIGGKKEDKKEFLNQTGFSMEKVEKVLKTEITLKKKQEEPEQPEVMVVTVPRPSYRKTKGVFTPKPVTEEEKKRFEEEEKAKRPIAPSINFKKKEEEPVVEEPAKPKPRKKNFARPAVPITADWETMNAKTLRELPEMAAKEEEQVEIKVKKSDLPNYDIYSEMTYESSMAAKEPNAILQASLDSAAKKEAKAQEQREAFAAQRAADEAAEQAIAEQVAAEQVVAEQNVAEATPAEEAAPVSYGKPVMSYGTAESAAASYAQETEEAPKAEVKPEPVKRVNPQDIVVPKDIFANAKVIAVIKNGVKTSTTADGKQETVPVQPVKKTIQKYTSDFETTTVKSIRKLRAMRQEQAIQDITRMLEGENRKVVAPRPKKTEESAPAASAPVTTAAKPVITQGFIDPFAPSAPAAFTEPATNTYEEPAQNIYAEPAVNTNAEPVPEEIVASVSEPVVAKPEPAHMSEVIESSFDLYPSMRKPPKELMEAAEKAQKAAEPLTEPVIPAEETFVEPVAEVVAEPVPETYAEPVIPAEEAFVEPISESVAEPAPANEQMSLFDLGSELQPQVIENTEEAVAEAPKTGKTTRKPKTTEQKEEGAEGTEAPKKRGRKPKAKPEDGTAETESAEGGEMTEAQVPKKPRKPRAKKTDAEPVIDPETGEVISTPKKTTRKPRAKKTEEVVEATETTETTETTDTPDGTEE